MQLEYNQGVERDAYGQPLSPTHLISSSKAFSGQGVGASPGQMHSPAAASQNHGGPMSSPTGAADQDRSKGTASQKAGGRERAGGPTGSGGGNAGEQAAAKALGPAENLQTALKGPPKMSGLTSFEYNVDSQLRYNCADTKPDNVDQASTERYQKIFHREEFLSRANSNANS